MKKIARPQKSARLQKFTLRFPPWTSSTLAEELRVLREPSRKVNGLKLYRINRLHI